MKFFSAVPYMVWLVISAVFFAFGEFWSKKFALDPGIRYVVAVLAAYLLGTLAWFPAIFQKNQLSIVGTMWSVMSLLATVLIGVLLFGERLSRLSLAGIGAALVAIVLLSLA